MKFNIGNREYEDYQLSNKQLRDLLRGDNLTQEERDFLMAKVFDRFDSELCPKKGEDDDDVFARQFGNFVNGKMYNSKKVAERMSRDHRYLQGEMFKVCMAYIKILADNYEKDWYDARNEYACKTSSKMVNHLKETDWPY